MCGVWQECIAALHPARVVQVVKDCIYDQCQTKMNNSLILCESAERLATECQNIYGLQFEWRDKTYCRMFLYIVVKSVSIMQVKVCCPMMQKVLQSILSEEICHSFVTILFAMLTDVYHDTNKYIFLYMSY